MAEVCPICQSLSSLTSSETRLKDNTIGVIYNFNCHRCGNYRIKDRAKAFFERKNTIPSTKRAAISVWISNQTNAYIDEELAFKLKEIQSPKLNERINELLRYIFNKTTSIGSYIELDAKDPAILNCTHSINDLEVYEIIKHLAAAKYIQIIPRPRKIDGIQITTPGILFIEEHLIPNRDSTQGFVAMWFKESMTSVYDGTIGPAISLAGYKPHRVDRREHAGKVDDEIIAQIRRSKFVVADFTGHRGGVYYEAGFAHGLGLPVIMTCRDDHLNELHFDIRQYNCILWKEDNLKQFQEDLQHRIEAILGRGPLIHDTK